MSYVKSVAQIIVELLRENPIRYVERGDIRIRFVNKYPELDKKIQLTEGAKERRRRKTYLAGTQNHGGRSNKTKAREKLYRAICTLEDWEVLLRQDGRVLVLNVPKLVEIANKEEESNEDLF